MIARLLARVLLKSLQQPSIEIVLWNGSWVSIVPNARIRIHFRKPRSFYLCLLFRDTAFGDEYCNGNIVVEGSLKELLQTVYAKPSNLSFSARILNGLHAALKRRPRANSLKGARKNIHSHYDLGNDFYASWLDDPYMQYTCGYFPDPSLSLEQGQAAKMEHVCRKLRLKPKQTVVEAGCGWGGLARYMAKHYGVHVTSYNISEQQIQYAQRKLKEEGLEDRVRYVLDDYRNCTGQYDAFVSVGMLEHVGVTQYPKLGAVINRVLKPDGHILIHSIGRNKPALMNGWIEKRIFPGAYPAALSQMTRIFEPYSFSVLDIENLRLHYIITLEHWYQRFSANLKPIQKRYGEAFVKAWELYLLGSIEAFSCGALQLFQIQLAREHNNQIPYSREYLYR